MDNNTPVAPTDAQAPASVASTTNSNEQAPAAPTQAPEAPAAPTVPAEPTPEQIAKYFGTTPENLEKVKKFSENNGGFDKVFSDRKAEISAPKTQQPTQPSTPAVEAQQLPQQPTSNLSMQNLEAMAVKDFFKDLAANPEYANIADKLTDGTVMEQASKMFGIQLFANGDVNRTQLTDFAKMYSKTMPAAPAQAPMTNTPTVQPTAAEFTGPINSSQDALKVIQEHNAMVAAGKGDHPKYAEAQKFLTKGFVERHAPQRGFEPWAARKARLQGK